jgi:RNA-binding protein with serine-rich domain 1
MSCGRQWHALGTWWRSSTIESIVIGFVPFVLPSSYPLQDMGSRSPSRGRSRSRSHTPPSARPADRSLSRAPAHIHHHTHLLLDVASLRGRNQIRDRAHARLCHVIQGTDTERVGILLGLLHEVGAQVGGAGSRIYRERSYTRSPSRHGKIVVEKLTKNVNEAHLREIFGSYGQIESLDMPMNR